MSNLADGVLKVGAPLLAVSLTRSPVEVSVIGTATTLPWLLLALPAGAVADRMDRRRVMVVANVLRTGVLLGIATILLLGVRNLWVLAAAVLLAGVAEVFADTCAQAVLPMTVPRDRLAWANGRIVGLQTVGNDFLGAPLAGLLVAALPAAILGAPAILYGAAALLLAGMPGRYRSAQGRTAGSGSGSGSGWRKEIGEAMRFLWGHRFLRTLAVSAGLLNLSSAAYFAVFVLWAVGDGSAIGIPSSRYGLVMSALAAGALVGSLVSARVTVLLGEGRTLVGTWLANALLLLVPVIAPVEWALYPTAVLLGVFGAAANVLVISTRQRLIPDALLGRVNSVYRLIGMGGMPLGAALGGLVGELGLQIVFYGSVGVSLIAVGLVWRALTDQISGPLTSAPTISGISRSR
ncbi:MFS transporter [Nonomuraea sediminis]|uniref:MFS transporter n=1 Tax=Nonomuraea sediminis TaxID=2835864 RepID=UPI0027E11645|nr:MFS transporter [Nonomuraea sediminis]